MAALEAAIQPLRLTVCLLEALDGRVKPGHDEVGMSWPQSILRASLPAVYAAFLNSVSIVRPISDGDGEIATPASRSNSTFSLALSPKAWMMAPA